MPANQHRDTNQAIYFTSFHGYANQSVAAVSNFNGKTDNSNCPSSCPRFDCYRYSSFTGGCINNQMPLTAELLIYSISVLLLVKSNVPKIYVLSMDP